MFRISKCLFILSGVVSYFQFTSSSYISSEFYGNLIERSSFNFSIFVRNFQGIILYSIDTSYNKLLIELDRSSNEDIFIIKFKNNSTRETLWSKDICGCTRCSDVFMKFLLLLYKSQIVIECEERLTTIKLDHWSEKDPISGYPIPKNFKQKKYETFFMIGNVGPYPGEFQYLALENQLTGCLEIFHFNGKIISFKKNSLNVSSTCDILYTEENIIHDIRKNSTTSYKMYDCSVLSMNGHHCNTNFTKFPLFKKSYENIFSNNKFTFFRFQWKTMKNEIQGKSYCLLEFRLKDENIIVFSINQNGNLLMNIFNAKKKMKIIKFWETVPEESKKILLIYFEDNQLIIKIFDGEIIRIYREQLSTTFMLVNVGFCRSSSEYSKFQGYFNFKYNISSWIDSDYELSRTTTSRKRSQKTTLINTTILVIVCGLIIIIIIVTIVLLIFHFKKGKKSNENVKGNRTKTPSPNQYEFELNEAQNNINQYDVINADDKPSEENDYSMIL